MLWLLVLGIFMAVVFSKGGIDLVKGCVSLIFGAMLLLLAAGIG